MGLKNEVAKQYVQDDSVWAYYTWMWAHNPMYTHRGSFKHMYTWLVHVCSQGTVVLMLFLFYLII